MLHTSLHGLGLAAVVASLALAGCASNSGSQDPYARSRSPYGYGNYGSDPYYSAPGYVVIDPHAERLERNQEEERDDLEDEQRDTLRDLERQQQQQREALKDTGEWDEQDRRAQKDQRKQQKKAFEEEDRELRKQQRDEWRNY